MLNNIVAAKNTLAVVLAIVLLLFVFLLHWETQVQFGDQKSTNSLQKPVRVGVMIQATNKKYFDLGWDLTQSVDRFFLPNHNVSVFLFTDQSVTPAHYKQLKRISLNVKYAEAQKWPFSTLLRFRLMTEILAELEQFDYLFWLDADTLVTQPVYDDIFAKYVAVEHPHYMRVNTDSSDYPYERNPESTAYVSFAEEPWWYVCGAFWGGEGDSVREMIVQLNANTDADLAKLIIALVHDESHLNRYLLDHREQTLVLDTRYLRPQPPMDLDNVFRLPAYSESRIIARVKQKYVLMILPLIDSDWKLTTWFILLMVGVGYGCYKVLLKKKQQRRYKTASVDYSV